MVNSLVNKSVVRQLPRRHGEHKEAQRIFKLFKLRILGIMECWNIGIITKKPIPLFHYSNIPEVVRNFSKLLWSALITLVLVNSNPAQTKLSNYVNPFIGTDAHGHTYPGATLPFGMVQLSPDTDIEGWDWCSGYHHSDNSIMGFSHTHLSGTGIGDYGDILFMPLTGDLKVNPGKKDNPDSGYRSRFSHANETASSGYYSVVLDDYNIKVELTATRRAGFHKYTFLPLPLEGGKGVGSYILIDLIHGIQDKATDSEIKIIDNKTIEGYRRSTGWAKDHTVFFYAEFSKPFNSFGIVEDGKINKGKKSAKGRKIKSFAEYSTSVNEVIFVKVGISHTSPEGARNNLKAEIPHWNFEQVRKQAEDEWEKELAAISIETKNEKNKTIFYSALYHALLNPNTFSDADGKYLGIASANSSDKKVHSAKDFDVYTVFSLWDTFRAEHPLFTIIDRKRALDMVKTLISKYEDYGLLPVWELAANETGTMIGYHSIPVITDAYFKGIRDFDVEKAFEAMKKSAMQNHLGLDSYKEMGYITSDTEHESVSKTLEYAYDDWCIAQMAKELGKTEDYKYFIERAKFYVNVFDPSTLLMRPKNNGKWFEPFDPYSVSGNYTEANAWQYSFFVPQDVNNLKNMMGGDDGFITMLDKLFTADTNLTGRFQSDITGLIGQYAHGNEPSHHMAYLYNYAGAPWKTQERVHQILTTMYTDKPDGLSGNEDCGQMSAWYILSSMGFYPVTPGDDKYIIGTPHFEKVTINSGSNKFVMKANNLSDENFYIQSAKLNGKDYAYSYLNYPEIMNGGELVLEMGSKPSNWGKEESSRPKSFIDYPFVSVPFLTTGERVFSDSTVINLSSIDNSSEMFYTVDGADPRVNGIKYENPVVIKNSTILKMVSRKDEIFSKVVTTKFNKSSGDVSVKLNSKYHPNYTAGGDLGLVDSIKGTINFHTPAWQGYEGVDFDAVIDLGKIEEISTISTSFLQNVGSWIFLPSSVEFFISSDGKDFTKIYESKNIIDEQHTGEVIKDFEKSLNGTKARFVKVFAKNIGICPEWHVGAGGKAWIFIDEITIQ